MTRTAIGEDRLAVLGEALQKAVAGRTVRAALFTTFTFEPGFFELNILPNLFDRPFHQVEKIRRVQLEEAVQSTQAVAVYYDAAGISGDTTPAHLDVARIALRRRTGCFHPKLVMILVEDHVEDDAEDEGAEASRPNPPLSLIIGTLSANLTRAGWWENLETGHFEELKDRSVDDERCSFRRDLLSLLKQLRGFGGAGDDHTALDMIAEFVRNRVTKNEPAHRMHGGRYWTRLFHGQQPLAEWLVDIGLTRFDWNLEVISPYFDGGEARVLHDLVEAIRPKETRVFLPRDHAGDALVTPEFRNSLAAIATWSDLPADIQQRGGPRIRAEASTRRRVHAKVYRFWSSDGREVVLTGSVNLTSAAHSAAKSGNFEAAFFVDASDTPGRRRWWLHPLDDQPACAATVEQEIDQVTPVYVDLHLRYDWNREAFEYRLDDPAEGAIEVRTIAGTAVCSIPDPRLGGVGDWTALPDAAAATMRELLRSTSFVAIHHPKGTWRVLVREEGMHRRPSLLQDLSAEEILRYWSLLSDEQRATFIEPRLTDPGLIEGLTVTRSRPPVVETVFDRVAGVFHAFECQYRRLSTGLGKGETKDARATLFGAKYDSLPVLLKRIADDPQRDAVMAYLTFLCARQLLARIERDHPTFLSQLRGDSGADSGVDMAHLTTALDQLGALRDALMPDDDSRGPFLEWFEEMFAGVLPVEPVEEVSA